MKRLSRTVGLAVIFLAAIICAGCMTRTANQFVSFPNQTKRVESPALSRIYVLRPSLLNGGEKILIKDGPVKIGYTRGRSYLCWERKPGTVIVTGSCENVDRLSFNTKAGEAYFILQSIHMGVFRCRNQLTLIERKEALKWLDICRPPK